MLSKFNTEEVKAMTEAKSLVQSKPKEAPELLNAVIDQYKAAGKTGCALEARRWQCFALISNLSYDSASQHIDLLSVEAVQADQPRFSGLAEMYHGIVSLECGDSDDAVEHFGRAVQIATELEDLDLLYRVQTNLAYAQMTQERSEDALETLQQCIRIFDVDNVTASNATIYYNLATTTLQLAFRERVEGIATEERLNQAKQALMTAVANCSQDPILNLLTRVQSALFTGLSQDPMKGLEELAAIEPAIEVSSASHHYCFMVAKCQLLEAAGMWEELCAATNTFLAEVIASKSFVYVQSLLRQSSRAHAKLGEYEAAYFQLQQSLKRPNPSRITNGEERAKIASMQQDLERQKFDQEVLRMRNKTLIERNKILEQEARYDPLSTLLNRRGTEEALQQFTERKFAESFVIVMLDIDHFKKINDNFGHAIGDQVIHEFARCLTASKTNPAKLGRWGGEEFLLVYDVTDPGKMDAIGQTLVSEIRSLKWDHIHDDLNVTASCGLAMWYRGDSLDNAVRIADDMMYDVKHHGRNNWRVWSEDLAA